MIYLDYMATTPVDPRVAARMQQFLTLEGTFGNPASSSHAFGWQASEAVDVAREQVAGVIGADSQSIVWTSGATEANNLAILGAARFYQRNGKHIITSLTEHKAVLDPMQQLEREGFEITYLKPESDGIVTAEKVKQALRPDTILVSLMHVNNEIGVIQDIAAVSAVTRANGVLLHMDAAQSIGKVAVDVNKLGVDLASFAAHKAYGPKGIGCLYVKREPRVRLQPMMFGGGHERGMRPGTLATHQIVGMATAFQIATQELAGDLARIKSLRDRLWQGISKLPQVVVHGSMENRVANNLNVGFVGVDGEALMMALRDLAVSSGSACTSATIEPSHVLRALGVPDAVAHSSIRFSLGRFTTEAEIDVAIKQIVQEVTRLREMSPLWGT